MKMPEAGPIVAGHQPNFFPWFGYFEKMLKCDVFVFSDDVKYPKETYVNRVQILIDGKVGYLTLPVRKGGDERIADKHFVKDEAALERVMAIARGNLRKLPHANDIEPVLEQFASAFHRYDTVADLNIHVISFLSAALGIDTPTRRGTDLKLESYRRNERLIRRCQILGSRVYLCGQGADGYQDEELLNQSGIALKRIDYDVGRRAVGDDLSYSILVGLARHGLAKLRDKVQAWRSMRVGA
jgi:WbqC-like protein family